VKNGYKLLILYLNTILIST